MTKMKVLFLMLVIVTLYACGPQTQSVTTTSATTLSVTSAITTTSNQASTSESTTLTSTTIMTTTSNPITTLPITTTIVETTTETMGTTISIASEAVFDYDKIAATDLVLDLEEIAGTIYLIQNEEGEMPQQAEMSHDSTSITYYQNYLESLPVGNHLFFVESANGWLQLTIQVTDTRSPYLVSEASIYYEEGVDIVVVFELFGGEVYSLYGNDITADDYTVNGNEVTIDIDYVEAKFAENPDRTALIIGFNLTYPGGVNGGFLYIRP